MPFKDSSLDGAYAIEATCHTDKLEKVFREAYRVLKPGCCIVLQDWFMTDKYDPTNKEHRRIKHAIEVGGEHIILSYEPWNWFICRDDRKQNGCPLL